MGFLVGSGGSKMANGISGSTVLRVERALFVLKRFVKRQYVGTSPKKNC